MTNIKDKNFRFGMAAGKTQDLVEIENKSINWEIQPAGKANNLESEENVFFKLKELHGDQGIYLGQSILALVALNQSSAYSDEINHSFKIELFASLIEELNITPEELRKELDDRKEWDKE